MRSNATQEILTKKTYPIHFKVDSEKYRTLNFKGFEGVYIDSKVTNGKRLYYDQNKPFEKEVKYFDEFIVTKEIEIPKAYILQKGWHKVVERLKINQIEFVLFEKDTSILVEVNHIDDFKTANAPFEGHYLHYNTTIKKSTQKITFKKGDLYIPTNQNGIRFLLETLEAEATDSFFNWNFFDTILQQKEGYSAYVFEDIAAKILSENPDIKTSFEDKLKTDADFAKNPRVQLDFVFKNSPHYEKAHLRLPIFKVN